MTNYYVYYRVEAGGVDALRLSVQSLFRIIERETGVRGRWLRRRDEPATCMEVFEEVRNEAAFEALLARESEKLGLERHIERFVCA